MIELAGRVFDLPDTVAAPLDRGAHHQWANDRGQTAVAEAVFGSRPRRSGCCSTWGPIRTPADPGPGDGQFFGLPAMSGLLDAR